MTGRLWLLRQSTREERVVRACARSVVRTESSAFHRRSNPRKAGKEHVWYSPKQVSVAPAQKRLGVFGESNGGGELGTMP